MESLPGSEQKPTFYKRLAVGAQSIRPLFQVTSDEEIVVAVDAQLDRSIQCLRRDGRDAGELRRLRLLAAEATAHAPAFDLYLVRSQLQRTRYGVLHLARVLRRAMHEHRVVFLRDRIADLAFELAPDGATRLALVLRGLDA